MGNMAAFKDRLKKVRESTGLNRLQFSKFIGIENSSIYYYESGERYPDVFTLKKSVKSATCLPIIFLD